MSGCRACCKIKVDAISSHFKKYQIAFYFFTYLSLSILKNHRDVERQWQIEHLTNGDNKVAGR